MKIHIRRGRALLCNAPNDQMAASSEDPFRSNCDECLRIWDEKTFGPEANVKSTRMAELDRLMGKPRGGWTEEARAAYAGVSPEELRRQDMERDD